MQATVLNLSTPGVTEEKTCWCNLISSSRLSHKGRGFLLRPGLDVVFTKIVDRPFAFGRACFRLRYNNPTGIWPEGGTFTPPQKRKEKKVGRKECGQVCEPRRHSQRLSF